MPLNAENQFLLVGATRREQRVREDRPGLSLQNGAELSPREERAGIRGQFRAPRMRQGPELWR